MNNIFLPFFDFEEIQIKPFWTKDRAFEYLCADFLFIYYNLDSCPEPSDIPNFPWIESCPFYINEKKCAYQVKFGRDAFASKKWFYKTFETIKDQIKKWAYEISKLFLFSKEDLSPAKKQNFDKACESFSTETWIEIECFFWKQFKWILIWWDEKFRNLIIKYFNTDEVKKWIYEMYSHPENIDQTELNNFINQVENGFKWHYNENDIKLAQYYQKTYSYKKLSYTTYPKILDIYEKLEYDIAEGIFVPLEYWDTYDSLKNFLDTAKKELNEAKDLSNKYKIELEDMIWNTYWLFINYGTEWKSCLEYEASNKIHFKDKRTNG